MGEISLWLSIGWALIGGPVLVPRLVRRAMPLLAPPLQGVLSAWIQLGLLAAILFLEGAAPATVGLVSMDWSDLLWIAGGAAGILAVMGAASRLFRFGRRPDAQWRETAAHFEALSPAQLLLVAVTAGAAEEFIFRGFALERMAAATGSVWLAAAVSGLFFIGYHQRWGRSWLVPVALSTLLITLLYLATRSLLVVILVRMLVDGAGLLSMKHRLAVERAGSAKR